MTHGERSDEPARPRILVFYDEAAVRTFTVDVLGAAHEIVETQDARAALNLLMGSGHHFDVVIATCLARAGRPRYPVCVELVRTMFERWPSLPIVLISRAQDRPRLTAEVLVSGARALLPTPVAARELVDAVRRLTTRGRRAPRVAGTLATMRRVVGFLGEHFGENPSLAELADMAAMSRSHFSHTFHAVSGMPLRDYIRDLRLRRAHHLLVNSTASITTIAFETGFYDLPHFDKAFRQRIGVSPQAYRRQHGRAAAARADGRNPRR